MLKWGSRRKETRTEESLANTILPASEFNYAMNFAKTSILEENQENRLLMLDFMLDVVKRDLIHDLLANILYDDSYFKEQIRLPFPAVCYDQTGKKIDTLSVTKNKEVDLSKDYILVLPSKRSKLKNILKTVNASGFKYQENNHYAFYYNYIDLCYVYNGLHSITAGIYHKQGFIKAQECNLPDFFDHFYTDGLNWYNSYTNSIIGDVWDFRLSIIFEVAKLKYKLENKLKCFLLKDNRHFLFGGFFIFRQLCRLENNIKKERGDADMWVRTKTYQAKRNIRENCHRPARKGKDAAEQRRLDTKPLPFDEGLVLLQLNIIRNHFYQPFLFKFLIINFCLS